MRNLLKKLSFSMAVIMVLLIGTSFAESEKSYKIPGDNTVTISNVIREKVINVKGQKPVNNYQYVTVNSPARVTFNGTSINCEAIDLLPNGLKEEEDLDNDLVSIKFDVKKYTLPYSDDKTKVYDELAKEPEDQALYVSGNYATLSKPGIYSVYGANAVDDNGDYIIIEVLAKDSPVVNKPASTATAVSTSSKVLVNGKAVSFEAYGINGNNYFKLRDLAAALNSTEKNFEVGWDGSKNAINLTSGQTYTIVGGELKAPGKAATKKAALSTSKIYLDGEEVSLTAYTIGGNNYFKLRDIGKVIDFGVTWDGKTNTIGMDTSIGYTE